MDRPDRIRPSSPPFGHGLRWSVWGRTTTTAIRHCPRSPGCVAAAPTSTAPTSRATWQLWTVTENWRWYLVAYDVATESRREEPFRLVRSYRIPGRRTTWKATPCTPDPGHGRD